MQKLWTWLKPKLVWILAGIGLVLGGILTLVSWGNIGPPRRKFPERPELDDPKDVVVPDVTTSFEDKPVDRYEEKKRPENVTPDADVADLNSRFK